MKDEKTKQYQKRAKEVFNNVVRGLEIMTTRETVEYIRANLMITHLKGVLTGIEEMKLIEEKL